MKDRVGGARGGSLPQIGPQHIQQLSGSMKACEERTVPAVQRNPARSAKGAFTKSRKCHLRVEHASTLQALVAEPCAN